jgi:HD-like signal output (HDOD) protein
MDIIDYERAFLQTDHAKVGMILLQHWNLPNEITIPVGFHHASELAESSRLETRIVALANILARCIDFHMSEEDDYIQQIKEYVSSNAKLPQVAHFQGNIEDIFKEFYGKVNDPERLFF